MSALKLFELFGLFAALALAVAGIGLLVAIGIKANHVFRLIDKRTAEKESKSTDSAGDRESGPESGS